MEKISLRHIGFTILALKGLLILVLLVRVLPGIDLQGFSLDKFLFFVLAGFTAQMIDGTLGMAYGASCSSLLMYLGIPPAAASASVHTAEVFTTGISGLSHIHFKNIDKALFFRIVITGVLGAAAGAFVISELIDGKAIKPFIAAYLLFLGVLILIKGIRNKPKVHTEVKRAELLALFGGFMDATGGGGWGPIVTSNIINQGKNPAETIGTVNLAEFFVAFASTGVFIFFMGIESWQVILGLVTGGIFAAPIGGYLASRVNKKALMTFVGAIIVLSSAYTLVSVWGN